MSKPTRVLCKCRSSYIAKNGIRRSCDGYKCDNGVTYTSLKSLADAAGVFWRTMYSRMQRYGLSSEAVLYDGCISVETLEDMGIDTGYHDREKSGGFPMSLCKRDGLQCDRWSDRLGQRLNMEGCGKNCNPENTNSCYRHTPDYGNLYGSALAGHITF